jgi:hypothetical protein
MNFLFKINSDKKSYIVTGTDYENYDLIDVLDIPKIYKDLPVTHIANEAFAYHTLLQQVTFPETLTHIGDQAFEEAVSLKTISLPQQLISIGSKAFSFCNSLISIYIPKSVKSIGQGAFWFAENLKEIVVDKDNSLYASIDGVLYNKDGSSLIKYPEGKKDKIFQIPFHVTTIMEEAFSSNPYLKNIVISKNVKTIQQEAFGDLADGTCHIKIEFKNKPLEWHKQWNTSSHTKVSWNVGKNS